MISAPPRNSSTIQADSGIAAHQEESEASSDTPLHASGPFMNWVVLSKRAAYHRNQCMPRRFCRSRPSHLSHTHFPLQLPPRRRQAMRLFRSTPNILKSALFVLCVVPSIGATDCAPGRDGDPCEGCVSGKFKGFQGEQSCTSCPDGAESPAVSDAASDCECQQVRLRCAFH